MSINRTGQTTQPVAGAHVKGYINHGSDPDVARPNGFDSLEWRGTVFPNNALPGEDTIVLEP